MDKGTSAGGKHGSNARTTAERADKGNAAAAGKETVGKTPSGLNEHTGEFRVGEKVIFGMRNGNVLLRHSPQGDEVEVAETTLAGLIIDAFFSNGKLGDGYPTVQNVR